MAKLSKTEELFYKFAKNEFEKIRKNPDFIFESLNFALDWEKEYQKFKESSYYMEVLHENSDYEKIKIIQNYLNDKVLFPLVESLYFKATDLSIAKELLLENTYDHFLKKNVKNFNLNENDFQKIKSIENKIYSLEESERALLLEEFFGNGSTAYKIKNAADTVYNTTKNFAGNSLKFAKKLAYNTYLTTKILEYVFKSIFNFGAEGLSTFTNNNLFGNSLYNLINDTNNLKMEGKTLIKTINPDNTEVRDFLKDNLNIDIKTILKDCWQNNINTLDLKGIEEYNPTLYKIFLIVKRFLYTHGYAVDKNLNNVKQAKILALINEDPKYNKMISRYRVCFYNTIIEYIESYAMVSFDIGDIENKFIKKLNNLKGIRNINQVKSFQDFYNFNPRNEAERVFLLSISALMSLKTTILLSKIELKKLNFYDRYIGKDVEVINRRLDQAIANISEAGNNKNKPVQRNYEESLNDNKQKKLAGNEPTKPRKTSVFDI